MSTSIELLCCLVLVCISHVTGQLVSCRASASCSGGPGDDVGVAVDGRGCCVDNPRALAFVDGKGSCVRCVVVGFLNTTFSGVEQGPGHSVPVGYRKGAASNLVFNVGSTPGTAREGPQFDYTVNTVRVRALANGQLDNVVVTFRVDTVAQEPNETFTLTLTPLNAPPPREGLFFQNSVNVTIIDSDNVEFSFTEDDYRASEPSVGGSPSFLPVIVSKSTRIASRVELVVTPLTVLEAIATFLPLPPNIPNDNPRSPPFANLHDFNNTNITIIFEPDEDAEVSEMSVPILVFDDAINEATEQVFVIELRLISSLDPTSVDLSVRSSSLCRIIDNDPIRIGFELPGYTYTEPLFDVVVDQFFLSLTGRPENGPIYLIKEDHVTSEQTFLVSIQVRDSAPSGTTIQPATIDQDYGFGAVGQTSVTFLASEQRILVPFNLFADNLTEGTEAFQANESSEDSLELRLPNGTLIGVERFPTFLRPEILASEIFIIIEDDDSNDTIIPASFLPFGLAHGDSTVPRIDDGSTEEIQLETDIVFFGSRQNALYVNTNGVLSFGQTFTRTSSSGVNFNSVSSPPIIAPFWDDVDVRNGGRIYYRQDNTSSVADQVQQNINTQFPDVGFFYPSLVFVATWDRVERFQFGGSSGATNTFQVVIASDGRRTFVRFSYGDIQWGGFNTLIGVSAGDRINFITHPASLSSSVTSLLDNTTVTYRVENATTVPPTTMPPTTVPPTIIPPPFVCFVEGQVLTYFNDTSDGRLSQFQGTFEICIGGFYGSVCDIGWNQEAAQTLCHSRFGSRYVAEPLYGLDFPSTRRFVAQHFNCSNTTGGLRSCRYDTGIDAQCNIGSHVAGVRCTESNDTIIPASFLPFGSAHGDSTVPRTDDGSTREIRLGTDIVIFGSRQNRLYVNTNGVLSFGRSHISTSSGGVDFNLIIVSSPPIIAPFWDDINIVFGGAIYYRQDNTSSIAEQVQQNIYTQFPDVGFFYPSLVFVATWDIVEAFSSDFRGLVNTFQVVIASDGRRTFVRFSYGDIQWGGSNTLIGVSAGDRINFITHPASLNSSVTSLLDNTTVTYRVENATTVLPTTMPPTTIPPPIECLVEGQVLTYFSNTSDRQLRRFQGTFEICIGGFYGSVCDIGWNQAAAQTLCHSQFGSRYVAEPLYGLGFPIPGTRRFVAQRFNCSSTTGGLKNCSYSSLIDAQCNIGPHVAGVRCTESFLPFGSAFGDSRVPTSDDGSTREIRLGTDIVIFGSRQNRLYVNTNGVLSFGQSFTRTSSSGVNFNSVSSPRIIAPFWDDVNVVNGGTIYYRQDNTSSITDLVQQNINTQFPDVGFFYPSLVFVATWDRVVQFGSSSGAANTFQVVIASDGRRTFVTFNYGDIQWGGSNTLIGVSAGDRANFITHPASLNSSVTSLLDHTTVTYRIENATTTPLTTAPPTTMPPTTTPPPIECFVEGQVLTYFSNASDRQLRRFQGTFEICIGGFYGSVCDIGWNQAAAQTLCHSQFGSRYVAEPLYGLGFPGTRRFVAQRFNCSSTTGGLRSCRYDTGIDAQCNIGSHVAGVRCTESNDTTDFLPFGSARGDSTVPTSDDGSTIEIRLGTDIVIFGSRQNRLYVNTNGVLSFGRPHTSTSSGGVDFNLILSSPPIIAPFWDDINIVRGGAIYYRQDNTSSIAEQVQQNIYTQFPDVGFFYPLLVFVATWDRVEPFSNDLRGLVNTFQAVIASDGRRTFVRFSYGDIQWGGSRTLIGVSAGDRINFITHPASLSSSVTSLLDNTTVTYRVENATTVLPTIMPPTTVPPTTTPPPFECFVEGQVLTYFNDTSDGRLSQFQGTFEICIGGFYGSVCDIGWNQAAAQTLCHSQFGSRYVAEPLYGLDFPSTRRFVAQRFNCSSTTGGLRSCRYDTGIDAQCNIGSHVAGVRCTESNDTTDFLPFGLARGDSTVPTSDDGSTREIRLGTDIVIFGSRQNRLYVNTNGVLSFGRSHTSTSSGGVDFNLIVSSPPIIAPFWDDINIVRGGAIYYRQDNTSSIAEQVQQNIYTQFPDVGFFYPSLVFVATWDRVEPFSSAFRGLVNTFQVVIASDGRRTFVRFSYEDIQWGGSNTLIGVSAGDRANFITHPASLNSSVTSLLDHTTVTYRIENATTVLPTTPPPIECFVEGRVLTYFNDTSDRRLSQFQGTFEICIGGFYGSVCDIGWNQEAAQTLCHSQFGQRYVAEPLYGLGFPRRRFVAQHFNCSSTTGGLGSCSYDTVIDAQCHFGPRVAGVRCTESNDTVIIPAGFLPFGSAHGDSRVPRFDDGSTGEIQLGTDIVIFGSRQNRLYVNSNGVLSLERPFTDFSSNGFNFNDVSSPPIIAPFWDDINVIIGGTIYYRQDFSSSVAGQVQQEIYAQYPNVGFFYPSLVFVATWDRVAAFSSNFSGLANTFQVVIASDGGRTFVRFSYGDIQWGGFRTLIGVSAGDGSNFITHPASLSSSVLQLDSTSVTYQINEVRATPLPPSCLEFDLQLVNLTTTYTQGLYLVIEGNIEVCINGTYVAVCDLGWDHAEAQLACNAVGYTEPFYRGFAVNGLAATTSIGVENVVCPSNTTAVSDCSGEIPPQSPRCLSNFSAAGVRCIQERAQCFSDGDFSGLNITYESYLGLLVGADFSFTSRVVVCQNGIYGSVCDINWDQDDANILCNSIVTEQERYEATPLYGFDIGADPIVLESINCAGDEFNISSCPISPLGQITNSLCRESNRGAGVRCRLTPDSCFNGQGRLVDGPAFYEGRLEVCVDNQWHSVCEEDFDMAVATSVCRDRIRLTGNQGIAVYGNAYGSGSGPTLTACSSAGFTYFVPIGSCPFSNLTCSSEREVGVRCPRGQLDILAIPMGSGRVGSSSFSIQCFAQQFPWNTTLVSGGWYDADGNPVVASSNGGPVSVDVILNMYNSLPINLTYTFRNQLNFDHPLSISDGGYYNCNITVELHYPDGSTTKLSNSTVYPLIIEAPPPTSLTIISGGSPIHNRPYAAICLVDFETAVPLDVVTMEWRTVDGDPLIELSDRVSVSQIRRISDSIFARDVIVRPLRAEDSGTYICEVGITGRFVTNSSVNVSADIAVIVPPPAPKVQGLCSVVVWNSPEVSCEGISGYDVRLYSPQSVHRNVTRRVEANGTYYIIKDEDNLAGSDETYVQVRIIHNSREGEWSEGISLGCEKPTVPEMPRVYFMLQRKIYRNNSAIPLTEIGEGDNALHCKTDKEECCGTVPNRFGEFYYPNGIQVPVARRQHGFYRNRGDQVVRLNRRERATSPTGTYRCEIPNADDEVVKIYITLTGN